MDSDDHFINYFEFKDMEEEGLHFASMTKVVYFSLTTLTTIGFGDIHPRTRIERIFGLPLFIFGVAIFGIIMQNFQNMFEDFIKYAEDLEESEFLTKFI